MISLPSFFIPYASIALPVLLPVSFGVSGDPVRAAPHFQRAPQNPFRLRIYEASAS